MAEQIDLTAPVVTSTTRNNWKLSSLTFDIDRGLITIYLRSNTVDTMTVSYPTPAVKNPLGGTQPSGAALLTALNTANLTTNSLVKRTFTQLITDGYLVGAVSGTPS